MQIPDLTFDGPTHTYYFKGRRVPNVTLALKMLLNYSRIPPDVLERARIEGVHIHRMAELYFKRDLDEDSLPDWLRPRLAALKAFEQETGFVVEATEKRVYHPGHFFAGTLDLAGELSGLKKKGRAIIDIKRSLYAGPVVGYQTAAYQEAENAERRRTKQPKIQHRFALQLQPNGRYKLTEYGDPGDFHVFLACLTLLKVGATIYETEHA